jgi:hypothetical protein
VFPITKERFDDMFAVLKAVQLEVHELSVQTLAIQQILLKGVTTMAADLTALTAQVVENTQLEGSAVQLIQNIAAQMAAARNDPIAVQALVDKLQASATALSAAVIANTPAAPVSPPATMPPPVTPTPVEPAV